MLGWGGLAVDLVTMVPVQLAAAANGHEATGFDAYALFSALKLLRSVSSVLGFGGGKVEVLRLGLWCVEKKVSWVHRCARCGRYFAGKHGLVPVLI